MHMLSISPRWTYDVWQNYLIRSSASLSPTSSPNMRAVRQALDLRTLTTASGMFDIEVEVGAGILAVGFVSSTDSPVRHPLCPD